MELEFAAGDGHGEAYEFAVSGGAEPWIVDWEPMLRQLLAERDAGRAARRFHETLARMMVAVAQRAGEPRVVLSGGCFQNKYLTECALRHMRACGLQSYFHQRVPPNDGGISLGQIVAAGAA